MGENHDISPIKARSEFSWSWAQLDEGGTNLWLLDQLSLTGWRCAADQPQVIVVDAGISGSISSWGFVGR